MTERERLIELCLKCDKDNDVLECFNERPTKRQAAEILADHLLANGIIVPPCMVGQTVYYYSEPLEELCTGKVILIQQNYYTPDRYLWFTIEYCSKLIGTQTAHGVISVELGKTVFLSREEAEKALAEKQRKEDEGK